jgi:hypothetical protein
MSKFLGARLFILTLFVASVFVSLKAAPTEIKLTVKLTIENDRITEVIKTFGDNPSSRISKNSTIHLAIEEVHQNPAPAGYDIKDHIEIEFTHADLAADKPAVLTEPYFSPVFRTAGDKEPILKMESDLRMDLASRKYSLKINRYASLEDQLRGKNPATVYEGNFSTYRVYYVGLNAGWLLPLNKNFYSYTLYHTDPADASDGSLQTIRRTRAYQTKAVLFASFYPGGIEPEGPLSWKNTHFNLGTELSSSIMKSLYIGAGYDFRFFSVNFFYGITKAPVLPEEYSIYVNRTIVNKKITSLPLLEKWDKFVGFAISFPFSLAAIFGKLIGL